MCSFLAARVIAVPAVTLAGTMTVLGSRTDGQTDRAMTDRCSFLRKTGVTGAGITCSY